MANWKQTVDIAAIMNDDSRDFRGKTFAMGELLSQSAVFAGTPYAQKLLKIAGDQKLDDDQIEGRVNRVLNDVYNFADAKLIWMGM